MSEKRKYAEKTYEEIFELYREMIMRICILRCKNEEDAKDCLQNVFMKLYISTEDFETLEHVKAWLIRVAINECKSLNRSLLKQRTTSLEPELISDWDEIDYFVEQDAMLSALGRIKKKYRDVLYLYYYESCDTTEIAEILDENINTVKSRLLRGRKLLEEAYQPSILKKKKKRTTIAVLAACAIISIVSVTALASADYLPKFTDLPKLSDYLSGFFGGEDDSENDAEATGLTESPVKSPSVVFENSSEEVSSNPSKEAENGTISLISLDGVGDRNFIDEYSYENGFFYSNEDTWNKPVYVLSGDSLSVCEKNICSGTYNGTEQSCDFSFSYYKNGHNILPAWDDEETDFSLCPFLAADGRGILYTDRIEDGYSKGLKEGFYIDFETGQTEPVMKDMDKAVAAMEILEREGWGSVQAFFPCDASDDGRFILYRSNVERILDGSYREDEQKGDWYALDTQLNETIKIEAVSWVTRVSDMRFIDNTRLALSAVNYEYWDDPNREFPPAGIFNLETKELTVLSDTKDYVEGRSMLTLEVIEDDYIYVKTKVTNLLTGQIYYISFENSVMYCWGVKTFSVIYEDENGRGIRVLLLDNGKVMDFGSMSFEEMDIVEYFGYLEEDDMFLIEGQKDNKKVGYILKINDAL